MKETILDDRSTQSHFKGFTPPKKSKYATKAFVFGIVGIPVGVYFVGIVFAILALVFSAKAFKELESDFEAYRKQKWKMVLGKALGWVGVGVSMTYGIFIMSMLIVGITEGRDPFNSYDDYDYYDDYNYNDEYWDEYDESYEDDTYKYEDSPF